MSNVKQQTEVMRKIMNEQQSPAELKSGLHIQHFSFHSTFEMNSAKKGLFAGNLYYHELVDCKVSENTDFTYPVIVPDRDTSYEHGIFLLHGLNEKSWDKYLAWASELATRLKCPVVLFPIAYHMNRAPKSWSDPRQMKDVVSDRNHDLVSNDTTFANAALSTRLGSHPEQFIYSGIQSYYDFSNLADGIQKGEHPLFKPNTSIDFFAYSIGAFLAQILCIGNPSGLFDRSKLFIFAGGPTFDTMMGTSRYIMDLKAFKSLLTLKRKRVLKKVHRDLREANLPDFESMWRAFYGMLHHRKGQRIRNEWLDERGSEVQVIALKNDQVMPAKAIIHTFGVVQRKNKVRIDVIDFPYAYTHENPFPLKDEKIQHLVNRSFDVVFEKAIRFYNETEKKLTGVESFSGQAAMRVLLA
ncbi:MAG: DUF6051 family protein [Prolixibacteraceae bacterium]